MPQGASEATLVRGLQRREQQAWEDVYRAQAPRLTAFAYRLTASQHDAADLVQETFVRALPRLDELDPETVDVSAYLFATLRNLFLKNVERARRCEPVDEVPEPWTPALIEDDPERSLLLRDQQFAVQEANASLAPRQRLVLALRELEDRSYGEIAELVGLNENAVAQLILRARATLRERVRLGRVDASQLAPACQVRLADLSAFLDQQLRGARLRAVREHLATCTRCRAVLDEFRTAGERYRVLVPPALALEALRGNVEDALARAGWQPVRAGAPADLAADVSRRSAGRVGWRRRQPGSGDGAACGGSPGRRLRPGRASTAGILAGAVAIALAVSSELAPQSARVAGDAEVAALGPAPVPAGELAPAVEPVSAEPLTAAPLAVPPSSPDSDLPASTPAAPAAVRPPDRARPKHSSPKRPAKAKRPAKGTKAGGGARALEPPAPAAQPPASAAEPPAAAPRPPAPPTAGTRELKPQKRAGGRPQPPAPAPPEPRSSPPVPASPEPPGPPAPAPPEPAPPASTEPAPQPPAPQPPAPQPQPPAPQPEPPPQPQPPPSPAPAELVLALPDLVVGSSGSTVTVSNLGTAGAGAFVVQVTGAGSFTVGGLAAGASATFRFGCSSTPRKAIADAGGQVAESNEGNNVASVQPC